MPAYNARRTEPNITCSRGKRRRLSVCPNITPAEGASEMFRICLGKRRHLPLSHNQTTHQSHTGSAMNDLTERAFHAHRVRTVSIDGQLWFLATDVCDMLGFTTTAGAAHSIRHLDPDQKRRVSKSDVNVGDVSFPNRGTIVINESGLYWLILRSDKPEARQFQDWVTRVVLPSIRQHGGYIMGEEKVTTGEMSEDELLSKAVQMVTRKVERLRPNNLGMQSEGHFITLDATPRSAGQRR